MLLKGFPKNFIFQALLDILGFSNEKTCSTSTIYRTLSDKRTSLSGSDEPDVNSDKKEIEVGNVSSLEGVP